MEIDDGGFAEYVTTLSQRVIPPLPRPVLCDMALLVSAEDTALPGALDLLKGPVPVAVVTSERRVAGTDRLDAAGLPWPFAMVAADSIPRRTASLGPYVVAARMLGLDPDRCDVLDGTPDGVRFGRAAGARVYGVTATFPREQLGHAHEWVADVPEYLLRRSVAGQS